MLPNAIANGILVGAVYGLIAAGLSLVFGVMGIINFAHGAFIMMIMFFTFYGWNLLGLSPYWVVPIAAILYLVSGYIIQGFLVNPLLRRNEPMAVLLVTAGVMMILESTALIFFGPDYRAVKMDAGTLTTGSLIISWVRLKGFCIATVTIFSLHWIMMKTDLGKAIRAISQDREASRAMGIADFKIFKIAFGLGLAMTGISAVVLTTMTNVYPSIGGVYLFKAFVIVVLGGLGSIPGAYVGGIVVGLIESIGTQYLSFHMSMVLVFAIFVWVLVMKPTGLLGVRKE